MQRSRPLGLSYAASNTALFPALHNSARPPRKYGPPDGSASNALSRITPCRHPNKITIAPHLTFDAITAGAPGAPLVLLLHGFAELMHCWRAQVAALGDMGYRAIAPSQRGYSPGARPDPREFSHYLIDRLMDDAMAIVAAAGYGDARFHLVGHDWGGSIAWGLADRHHERLASLTILSRPHPNAFNRALQLTDGEQAQRSRHHKAFLEPDAADVVLADDAKWLRERLAANGVPA